jgi:hypothetical protein
MKNGKKLVLVLMASLIMGFAVSCATTGQYMPLDSHDTVIGTVQISFTVRNTINSREALNILSYAKLLEMAQLQYGTPIDVRDIMWASRQQIDNLNTEYSATGKVIKIQ